jgi:hypothetical protein
MEPSIYNVPAKYAFTGLSISDCPEDDFDVPSFENIHGPTSHATAMMTSTPAIGKEIRRKRAYDGIREFSFETPTPFSS